MKQGRTILVVDDEPTIVDGLRMTLEAEGYAIRIAGGVQTAMSVVAQSDVHAAIVDARWRRPGPHPRAQEA